MNIVLDIFKNKKGKVFIPFLLLGLAGLLIEVFFTALTSLNVSLKGNTSLWCILIYGTGGTILSIVNELPKYYKMSMRMQTLIGGTLIVATEFIYGVIFNIILGLDIWNYSRFPNILGQIDVVHTICWFVAIPGFIWLYDVVIGYGLYREDWHYNLLQNYKEIFTKKLVNKSNEC
jgi:hypothetical protein